MKITETYPLPPYSTINGLIHKILNATEYIPFNISVQEHMKVYLIITRQHIFIKR